MNKPSREEAKQMLTTLLNKLKEQGVVQEAGVLDMGSEDQIKRSRAAIDKLEKIGLPQEIIDKLRGKMDEVENKKCKCSDCFNFNTFETVLRDEAKKFEYATVEFNGKSFDIKYCEDNEGG